MGIEADGFYDPDPIKLYRYWITSIPMTTPEEVVECCQTVEECFNLERSLQNPAIVSLLVSANTETLSSIIAFSWNQRLQARTRLVEGNLRLVMDIAADYLGKGLPFEDLIQAGNKSLLTSARLFNYHLGNQFSTYATGGIKQGIVRALQQDPSPISIPVGSGRKIRAAIRTLTPKLERVPTPEEISHQSGVELEAIISALPILSGIRSLDQHMVNPNEPEEGPGAQLGEVVSVEEDVEEIALGNLEALERRSLTIQLMGAMQERNPLLYRVLVYRYNLDGEGVRSFKEIGKLTKTSRDAARTLHRKALTSARQNIKKISTSPSLVRS